MILSSSDDKKAINLHTTPHHDLPTYNKLQRSQAKRSFKDLQATFTILTSLFSLLLSGRKIKRKKTVLTITVGIGMYPFELFKSIREGILSCASLTHSRHQPCWCWQLLCLLLMLWISRIRMTITPIEKQERARERVSSQVFSTQAASCSHQSKKPHRDGFFHSNHTHNRST